MRLLEDRIFPLGVHQLIDGVTWIRDNGLQQSCIDHIYTNSSAYTGVAINNCLSSSDHNLVSVVKLCNAKLQRTTKMRVRSFKKFIFDDYDWYLRSLNIEDILNIDDPEQQVLKLTAAMNVAADQTCPLVTVKSREFHTAWMTDELRNDIKSRDKTYAQYKESLKHGNQGQTDALYSSYKKQKNHLRKAIPRRKAEFNRNNINSNRTDNPEKCWNIMNVTTGKNAAFVPPFIIEDNGKNVTCPQQISEIFAEFFDKKVRDIHDQLPDTQGTVMPPWPDNLPRFEFRRVNQLEILDCIKGLSNSTSSGWDTISNNLVKFSKYQISEVLANITNKCFITKKFPESWKLARIRALHKKGSINSVKNYRPIALLCSLSKVVERAVFNQIYSHFTELGLFDKRQYGFRKGHSTTLAVLDLMQEIFMAKNGMNAKKVNTLLLDLSAAFDIVSHELLLSKLSSFGFSDDAVAFIKSYLLNRVVEVQVETSLSKRFKIKCGVPQGSVLGPLLYSILITDIQSINNKTKIIYADDTNCVVTSDSPEILHAETEKAMKDLIDYYHAVKLKLNPQKTEIINHDSKLNTVKIIIDEDGNQQTSVHHARMLGIQIDSNLDFKVHISNVVKDVKHRIAQFRRLPPGVSLKARRMLGIGLILSKIYFGIQIYSVASKSDLNMVRVAYNNALRTILGVSKMNKIKLSRIRRELGLLSFPSVIKYFDVTTLNRILTTKQPHHLYKYLEFPSKQTRASLNQQIKLTYIPKSSKFLRSFLSRSLKTYNLLPLNIRRLKGKKFAEAVREHFYEKENSNFTSCLIS